MKYNIIIVLIFINFNTAFSQVNNDLLTDFFSSTTYVVFDQALFSPYNFYIKDAIEKNWTITDYKIVQYDEFDNLRKDPAKSFLFVSDATLNNDKSGTKYNFLNLAMGSNSRSLSEMPDLVNIPLSLSGQEEEKWVYKLPAFILFMQSHLNLLKENPDFQNKDFESLYKDAKKSTLGLTLYLLKDDLEETINSIDEIKSAYPGKVKIVDAEELEKAIENRDPEIVFLHKVGKNSSSGNNICLKILIGTKDADIYYYSTHRISKDKPNLFLPEDLEKISI